MADRTIYVRDSDAELWEWAVSRARSQRMPVSGLIMNLLQEYRERVENDDADDT